MTRELRLNIDFRSGLPIYLQIVEQIERMVAAGALQKGDQLPTVRQLAADLQVNFNTVARSYRILDEAGVISTQHGRGTYIWDGQPGPAGPPARGEAPEPERRPPSPPKANGTGSLTGTGKTGRLLPEGSRRLQDLARQFFVEARRLDCSEAEALSLLEAEFARWQKGKKSP